MKLNLNTMISTRYWKLTASILVSVLLAGCGGGNGPAGNPLGCSGAGSSTGSSTSSSSSGTTTSCSSSSSSSSSSTTTGTASTGVVGSIQFVSSVPASSSIVFQGTGGAGRTTTAVLTFQVLDTQGNPLPNAAVSFVNNNTQLGTISPSSGTTNSTGNVVTTVTSVGPTNGVVPTPGTLTVTASAKGASSTVSAVSNLVIVSTGSPAAASFTIAPSVSNIEGYDFSGTTTTIAVLVTDVNGNPVVDGTAVAAHTNEGSIGSATSTNPGCTTINGICDLVFTSQNPRYLVSGSTYTDVGIATVTLTANGSNNTPITGSVQITQSGSWPSVFNYDPTLATPGWVFVAGAAEPFTIPNTNPLPVINGTSCSNITFLLTDEVGNPIANGTTVAASVPSGSSYTISEVGPSPIGNTPLNNSIVDFSVTASSITNIGLLNNYNATNQSAIYNPTINGTLVDISFTGGCPGSGGFPFTLTTTSAKGDKYTLNLIYAT